MDRVVVSNPAVAHPAPTPRQAIDSLFVVKLFWTISTYASVFLVLEFVPGGTLMQLQRAQPGRHFTNSQVSRDGVRGCIGSYFNPRLTHTDAILRDGDFPRH